MPARGPLWAIPVALALVLPASAPAQGIDREPFKSTSVLESGGAADPSISQDDRYARVIAFDSGSSDLVERDSNGETDVFAILRGGSFGNEGEPWVPGKTILVSRARDGGPANGPSYRPDVGGAPGMEPRCIAFISKASNLVRGDTNGKADAFVLDLGSKRIERVSVDSGGGQSNGDTTDVSVSGDCTRVAFTSDATDLAQTDLRDLSTQRRRAWRFGVTSAPGSARNVYVHVLSHRYGPDRYLDGLTFLVSASHGRAAGGESFDPALASRRGDVIAFASTAQLSGRDGNHVSDVYVKRLERVRTRAGRRTVGTLRLTTELISAPAGRGSGNGPSRRPALNGTGSFVFFETAASDLVHGDANGHSDVVRATRANGAVSLQPVSEVSGDLGNGPSISPVTSGGGTNALFLTEASNFLVPGGPQQNYGFHASGPGDVNGKRDAALWSSGRHIALIESRGEGGELLSAETDSIDMSARTNYIPFVAGGKLLLRYLGPRSIGN